MDVSAFQMLLLTMTSWLDQREREVLAFLIEENRVLRRQLGGRRLRLTDDDRRTLAARAYRVGRQALREVATIVRPDTLLRWHRRLIARKMDLRQARAASSRCGQGNPRIDPTDGGGESHLGLHAHPRGPQEPRAPRRPFNDCTDLAKRRHSAGAATSDLVADIPAGALG